MNKLQVIKSYFEALAKGDVPTAFAFFAPDAKWHQPGSHRFSGIKNNPTEIGAMISGMMEATAGTLVIAPNGPLMESGDLVASPVHFTATKGSKKLDMGGIDLFEVKEGKITQVWLFSEDQQVENEFWD